MKYSKYQIQISKSKNQMPSIRPKVMIYKLSDIEPQISSIRCHLSDIKYEIASIRYLLSDINNKISNIIYYVANIMFQI